MTQSTSPSVTDQLRLESLLKTVGAVPKLLILTHNDPDPDALATAVALRYIIDTLTPATGTIAYGGLIGRAENRALLHYLELQPCPCAEVHMADFPLIALVDSQPGAGNNALPPGRRADIVLDHHQPFREQTALAAHADVRLDVGSSSTIVAAYLLEAGLDISPRLATALFYGIQTDTTGFGRHASPVDRTIYLRLQPLVEIDELFAIQHARVSVAYFRTFARTLEAAELRDGSIVAHLGEMPAPDMAAEMADVLLRLEGVNWVLCSGYHNDILCLSLRSTELHPGAGQVAQQVVSGLGTAGGHGLVGGGQIRRRDRDRAALVREVTQRFLSALQLDGVAATKLVE